MSNPEHIVCRCEMVAQAEIEDAIAEGNLTINDIKRRTRAGMGICQGIFCNAAIARALAEHGVSQTSLAPMTARPPMRVIRLSIAAESITAERE